MCDVVMYALCTPYVLYIPYALHALYVRMHRLRACAGCIEKGVETTGLRRQLDKRG